MRLISFLIPLTLSLRTPLCGKFTTDNGVVHERLRIKDDRCKFKIEPERLVHHSAEATYRLKLDNLLPCHRGEVYLKSGNKITGPYCKSRRHRRNSPSNIAENFDKSGVEVIYTKTGGIRFRFNFDFEWELLPGIPGGMFGPTSVNNRPEMSFNSPSQTPKPTRGTVTREAMTRTTRSTTTELYTGRPTFRPTFRPKYTTTEKTTKYTKETTTTTLPPTTTSTTMTTSTTTTSTTTTTTTTKTTTSTTTTSSTTTTTT